MNIGVFFGSFNPIHLGHVAIAERFLGEKGIDELWLSVSPHNPLKEKSGLLNIEHRVQMAKLAFTSYKHIFVSDFEKFMPQPSFTYEALLELQRQHPEHHFILLIGGDNCSLFQKWRNYDKILNDFEVWAYPRDKSDMSNEVIKSMRILDAPLLDYASTNIREKVVDGGTPQGIPVEVLDYIEKNKLYR